MSWTALLALAVGLAMDATAVAVASAVAAVRVRVREGVLLATLFGFFQALMPVIGWAAGVGFAGAIAAWDHWLAFGLLAGIGGKMVHEASSHRGRPVAARRLAPSGGTQPGPFGFKRLVVMALATSIDALAAGVTLPLLKAPIVPAALVIGGVTFALCLVGVGLGRRLGERAGGRLGILGGVVLIGIGVKTLADHLGSPTDGLP